MNGQVSEPIMSEPIRRTGSPDEGHKYTLTGQDPLKICPEEEIGSMLFMYSMAGREVVIQLPGHMDVLKRATDTVQISKMVSIVGAEPAQRKHDRLPGTRLKERPNYKSI